MRGMSSIQMHVLASHLEKLRDQSPTLSKKLDLLTVGIDEQAVYNPPIRRRPKAQVEDLNVVSDTITGLHGKKTKQRQIISGDTSGASNPYGGMWSAGTGAYKT